MKMKFYKGVLLSHLKDIYIPGTVAVDFKTALTWKERISGKPKKGASSHIPHGKACVIEIEYEGEISPPDTFQLVGIHEHKRANCWTSAAKDKAQINTPVKYRILTEQELSDLYKP